MNTSRHAAPGEEHLRLRAAWQGGTGARRSSVLGLLALGAVLLTALGYGIATSGRGTRPEPAATAAAALGTGNGGDWLAQIPDKPRGVIPPAPPAPSPPPLIPANQEPAVPLPPVTAGPAAAPAPATAQPLTPEEQYQLELEKKRRETLLAAYVAPPVSGTTASPGSGRAPAAAAGETPALDPNGLRRVAYPPAGGSARVVRKRYKTSRRRKRLF